MADIDNLNAPELLNFLLENFKEQELKDKLFELAQSIKYNRIHYYRPYGHPETLMGGSLWEGMQEGSAFLKFMKAYSMELRPWGEWSEKPWQLNFHQATKDHQECMVMAANRSGKSYSCGAAAVTYHLTGLYPDWWEGKRFDRPVLAWTGSPTNETSRDIVQKELLGGIDKETKGTGSVPRHLIYGTPRTKQAGVSGVVDSFKVRHVSGGISECVLKTYEQGWRKWQGAKPQVVWLDEEPEDNELQGKIYTEALTRLLTENGIMLVTFTPLLGQTRLVLHYLDKKSGVYLDGATWDDAPHLNKDERVRLAGSYPDHEVEARTMGIPMMGEGAIFTVPESEVTCHPFPIPNHFARIKGIDFGIDHPAGLCDIAYDRDNDIIYVTRSWKKSGSDISTHAEKINAKEPWVPVSWPHDGLKRAPNTKGGNLKIKDMYRDAGVRLLGRSARYQNDVGGAQGQWPVIEEIKHREETGGIKYFKTCVDLLTERRNYHTKDGKINSIRDDCLKSMFYAVMMKRFATTQKITSNVIHTPQPFTMTR